MSRAPHRSPGVDPVRPTQGNRAGPAREGWPHVRVSLNPPWGDYDAPVYEDLNGMNRTMRLYQEECGDCLARVLQSHRGARRRFQVTAVRLVAEVVLPSIRRPAASGRRENRRRSRRKHPVQLSSDRGRGRRAIEWPMPPRIHRSGQPEFRAEEPFRVVRRSAGRPRQGRLGETRMFGKSPRDHRNL